VDELASVSDGQTQFFDFTTTRTVVGQSDTVRRCTCLASSVYLPQNN